MRKVSLLPYLQNVRVSIFHNVDWFLQHVEEDLSQEGTDRGKEDSEAERFLLAVVDYCHKLIDDPSKREKKRVRTRHGPVPGRNRPGSGSGSKVAAKEVINA